MWLGAGLTLHTSLVSCPVTQLGGSRTENPRPLALHLMPFHCIQLFFCEHWFWGWWQAFVPGTHTHTHTYNIRTMWVQCRAIPLGAETLPWAPFCPARLETVLSWESYRFHFVTWKLLQPGREPELTWSQGLNWIGSPWRPLASHSSLAGRKYCLPNPSPHSHTHQPRSSVAYHPNKVLY